MNTRRILLVTTPHKATLAPIYAALLLLVALSLLGLLVEDLRQSPTPQGARDRAIWL
jgi:uncharacterized membrane protein (DUF373 family)